MILYNHKDTENTVRLFLKVIYLRGSERARAFPFAQVYSLSASHGQGWVSVRTRNQGRGPSLPQEWQKCKYLTHYSASSCLH